MATLGRRISQGCASQPSDRGAVVNVIAHLSPQAGDNLLPVLAADIKRAIAGARQHACASLSAAVEAGERLIEAKALLRHGQWLPWLKNHVDISERHAQNYMRLARHKDVVDIKSATVADLTLRGAIAELTEGRKDLPEWLPRTSTLKIGIYSNIAAWHEIWVVPSSIFSGFLYVTGICTPRRGGGSLVGTRKPIRLDFVGTLIEAHCMEAHHDVAELEWTEHQSQAWSYNLFTESGVGDFVDELDPQETAALARGHLGGLKGDDVPQHYRHEVRRRDGDVRPLAEVVFGGRS